MMNVSKEDVSEALNYLNDSIPQCNVLPSFIASCRPLRTGGNPEISRRFQERKHRPETVF